MMDKGSELILDLILKKSEGQVTEEDRMFLRARRGYVPEGELKRLGILDEEAPVSAGVATAPVTTEPVAPAVVPEVAVAAPAAPVTETPASKPVSQMNKEELLALAASRGVAVPEGATNAQLKALLK